MYVPMKFLFWIAVWPFFGKKLSFLFSTCSVFIVVPLLSWTEGVRYLHCTLSPDHCFPFYGRPDIFEEIAHLRSHDPLFLV